MYVMLCLLMIVQISFFSPFQKYIPTGCAERDSFTGPEAGESVRDGDIPNEEKEERTTLGSRDPALS